MNQAVFQVLFGIAHRNSLLDAFTVFFAKYLPYLMVVALIYWLFQSESRKRLFVFAELTIAAILARGLVTEWIRFAYYNPRPFEALGIQNLIPESGASFPSGHMTFLFSLGLILWFYNRKFGWWFIGSAFIVGVARVISGVHWPLDILGGMAVGVLSAFLVHRLLKPYRERLKVGPELTEIAKIGEPTAESPNA